MDAFDYNDDLAVDNTRKTSAIIWNILTVLVLLTVLCVAGVFLMIFLNPTGSINPFPKPTLPAVAELPTSTPTPRVGLPATWTPTITPSPTITNTPLPSFTPTEIVDEQVTLTPEAPPEEGFPFVIQDPPGEPVYIQNIHYPDLGCDWMGLGGQAFALNEAPMKFLTVHLGGTLGGGTLDILTLTGTAPQYGEGGYEFTLADSVITSNDSVWVELLDQAGLPLSDKIKFDTFADCERNQILINFQQIR
jgi:hypothetical protein